MGKKLLVLDLDETLFHAVYPSQIDGYVDQGTDIHAYDYEICDCYPAFERPHVHNFLAYAFKNFDVGIWTSAGKDYAKDVVQKLIINNGHGTPVFVYDDRNCVQRRMWTDAWGYTYGGAQVHYIKDLKKLKKFGYPLSQILIVDDSPEKCVRQYGNYIRIDPYEAEPVDNELAKLVQYLDTIKDAENVRTIEKRGWSARF